MGGAKGPSQLCEGKSDKENQKRKDFGRKSKAFIS